MTLSLPAVLIAAAVAQAGLTDVPDDFVIPSDDPICEKLADLVAGAPPSADLGGNHLAPSRSVQVSWYGWWNVDFNVGCEPTKDDPAAEQFCSWLLSGNMSLRRTWTLPSRILKCAGHTTEGSGLFTRVVRQPEVWRETVSMGIGASARWMEMKVDIGGGDNVLDDKVVLSVFALPASE